MATKEPTNKQELQDFFVPEYGITVKAKNAQEAAEKAKKEIE